MTQSTPDTGMVDSQVPQSLGCATLTIMGVELTVHNLDNGQRIIEADGIHRLLEAMASGVEIDAVEATQLARLIHPHTPFHDQASGVSA